MSDTASPAAGSVPFGGALQTPLSRRRLLQAGGAGIVGAETLNACGQEAVDICSHASGYTGARAETIIDNCNNQGVKF